MTKARQRILDALAQGARIIVTNDNRDGRKPMSYTLDGYKGGEATLELFFPIMVAQKLIRPVEDGLFSGCSQTYVVVR